MRIKLLGSGCSNFKMLEDNLYEAMRLEGIEATIERIDNTQDIIRHGVIKTPALVIDGRIRVQGRIASVDDIKGYIKREDHFAGVV